MYETETRRSDNTPEILNLNRGRKRCQKVGEMEAQLEKKVLGLYAIVGARVLGLKKELKDWRLGDAKFERREEEISKSFERQKFNWKEGFWSEYVCRSKGIWIEGRAEESKSLEALNLNGGRDTQTYAIVGGECFERWEKEALKSLERPKLDRRKESWSEYVCRSKRLGWKGE
jgi:hypothetical protein